MNWIKNNWIYLFFIVLVIVMAIMPLPFEPYINECNLLYGEDNWKSEEVDIKIASLTNLTITIFKDDKQVNVPIYSPNTGTAVGCFKK